MRISNSQRRRRLDRDRVSRPMFLEIENFYAKGDDQLIAFLSDEKLKQIRNYLSLHYPTAKARTLEIEKIRSVKKIDPKDFDFFMSLLSEFDYFLRANEVVNDALKEDAREAFETAARFSMSKIGIAHSFKLTNPNILQALENRIATFPAESTRRFQDAVEIITQRFIEQGRAPYDSRFIRDLRNDLGYDSRYAAERFARTETGVITTDAQYQSYNKLNVDLKEWMHSGAIVGARNSHRELGRKKAIPLSENFNWSDSTGSYSAPHPLHWSLPASQVVNCKCDFAPAFKEDYVPPDKIWRGE